MILSLNLTQDVGIWFMGNQIRRKMKFNTITKIKEKIKLFLNILLIVIKL